MNPADKSRVGEVLDDHRLLLPVLLVVVSVYCVILALADLRRSLITSHNNSAPSKE